MSENEKKSGFKIFEKLKKIKHIEVYIAIIFIVILLLIYMSNFAGNKSGTSKVASDDLNINTYVSQLEDNLEEILGNIGGVTEVKVMITLDMNVAGVTESKITLDKFPPVRGVIITAKGLEDTAKKLQVLHAVEAVIEVSNGNIQILSK